MERNEIASEMPEVGDPSRTKNEISEWEKGERIRVRGGKVKGRNGSKGSGGENVLGGCKKIRGGRYSGGGGEGHRGRRDKSEAKIKKEKKCHQKGSKGAVGGRAIQ